MAASTLRRQVLVTGAAGGLGSAATRLLAARGWRVYAADLAAEALDAADSGTVTPVPLDVTSAESVAEAVHAVGEHTDGLDGVVNFAGMLAVGSLVDLDEETLRRLLDVNVLGTFRVNKAFFPLLRQRQGRIINISSETGHQSGAPFNGAYAMSKHAIEAYSDSLRRELQLLGMTVVKIQPGPFRTAMVAGIEQQFTAAAAASRYFSDVLHRMRGRVAAEQAKAGDPARLAAVVYEALTTPRPKPAYSVGQDPQRAALELLPTRWADGLLRRVLQPR